MLLLSNLGITMKFSLLINVDLWKRVTSSNTKPEVVWSRRGRHLEIVYDVITPPRVPDLDKFRNLISNSMQITAIWSTSQMGEEFQYGGRFFFETGSNYITPVD